MNTENIKHVIQTHLAEKTFPGIVLKISRADTPVFEWMEGEGMSRRTLFDLASLTKPLATTTAFLALSEAEAIPLSSPIGKFLPQLESHLKNIRLHQLLTHSSGLPPVPEIFRLFPGEKQVDRKKALDHLFRLPLDAEPGTEIIYSCSGYIMLTRILEKISGTSLSRVFRELITSPAGISDLMFNPPEPSICAPTEFCTWRNRRIQGEVHDENSCCFGGEGGNAGLFGTVDSVDFLLKLFREEGYLNNNRILSRESVVKMTSIQSGQLHPHRAAGFLTQSSESFAGPGFSPRSYGHTGFTGTSVWVDPEMDLRVVALTNRVYSGRDETADAIKEFRLQLHQAVKQAMEEE